MTVRLPLMAKTSAPRKLKVYRAEIDGLNEWIVAAPNRPAALQAFGVNQDLFAQGMAGEEADPDKAAQARAAPCTPLRRPKGSKDAFAPAEGAMDWSAAEPKTEGRPKRRAPDRKRLDRAEAQLVHVEDAHREAMAGIDAERTRLDQRATAEAEHYAEARAEAREQVKSETDAYKTAGGKA